MEMFNKSRYIQLTCLIQLATSTGKEYVIDTLAPGVWDEVGGLAPLFADRNIVKVGHSIGGMDVPSLHRDFGIFVVNAFDTFEAAQTLRLPSCRLDGVCQHYGLKDASTYKHLKSNYQMTDWTRRPMSDDMIRYGLYDVHFLLKLRTLMMRDLTHAEFWDHSVPSLKAERSLVAKALAATLRKIERQEGDVVDSGSVGDSDASFVSDTEDTDGYFTPQESFGLSQGEDGEVEKIQRKPIVEVKELRMHDRLMSVISKSQERCLALWTERAEPHLKNKAFLSMIHKAKQQPSLWTESHMKLYDELVRWRDMVAQEEKCLPGFVCPLEFLVMVASKQPTNDDALRRISYFLPPFLEGSHTVENSYRKQLLDITRASLQTDGSTEAPIVEEYVPKYKRPRIVQVVKETVPKLDVAGSWRMRLAAMVVLGAAVTIALVISGRRRK
jgi:ribonuclease D